MGEISHSALITINLSTNISQLMINYEKFNITINFSHHLDTHYLRFYF